MNKMENEYIGIVTLIEPHTSRNAIFSQGNLVYIKKEKDKEYIGTIFGADFEISVKVPKNKCTSLEKI